MPRRSDNLVKPQRFNPRLRADAQSWEITIPQSVAHNINSEALYSCDVLNNGTIIFTPHTDWDPYTESWFAVEDPYARIDDDGTFEHAGDLEEIWALTRRSDPPVARRVGHHDEDHIPASDPEYRLLLAAEVLRQRKEKRQNTSEIERRRFRNLKIQEAIAKLEDRLELVT